MERSEVIKYLASIKMIERKNILEEANKLIREKEKTQFTKRQSSYQKSVEKKELRGKEMAKKVIPGMIVICEGTKDRFGLREVLEVSESGIVARKIKKHRGISGPKFIRAPYITDHMWMKVKRIVSGNITLESE